MNFMHRIGPINVAIDGVWVGKGVFERSLQSDDEGALCFGRAGVEESRPTMMGNA